MMSANEPKIKILYAEDDTYGAELTKEMLEKEDFDLEIATNGLAAWKKYQEWKPDILLLDLDMPKKDGLELTLTIRQHDQQTHIIVYTSYREPAKEVALLDAGADEFISKDKPPQVLTAYMNRVRERIKKRMNIPYVYRLSAYSTYNHLTRELTVNGNTTQLKKIDGRFLQLLCAKNHEIAGKAYLIQGVWNKADMKKEPELKKYISHIRTLLKADSTLKIEYQDDGYILMSV